jgi:hypothetical protein
MRRPWSTGGCRAKKHGPGILSPALHCGVRRSMSSQTTWYLSRKKWQWDTMSSGYSFFHSKHYSTSTTSSLLYITYKFKALWNNTNLFLNLIFHDWTLYIYSLRYTYVNACKISRFLHYIEYSRDIFSSVSIIYGNRPGFSIHWPSSYLPFWKQTRII